MDDPGYFHAGYRERKPNVKKLAMKSVVKMVQRIPASYSPEKGATRP
jgi:hypothetical protein